MLNSTAEGENKTPGACEYLADEEKSIIVAKTKTRKEREMGAAVISNAEQDGQRKTRQTMTQRAYLYNQAPDSFASRWRHCHCVVSSQ